MQRFSPIASPLVQVCGGSRVSGCHDVSLSCQIEGIEDLPAFDFGTDRGYSEAGGQEYIAFVWEGLKMDQHGPNPSNHLLYWRKRKDVSLSKLAARIETAGRHYASKKYVESLGKGRDVHA
jgi:hypothetical protein